MRRIALPTFAASVLLILVSGCNQDRHGPPSYKTQGRLITLHTQPAGARVYQTVPVTGGRVDLGMTPLVNQPVMVLTSYKGSFSNLAEGSRLASEINCARVRIEKEGYHPWEGQIWTDPKKATERTITLEPLGAAAAAGPATTRPAP